MMFHTKTWQSILIITGMAISAASIYPCNVQAQSKIERENLIIAQNLAGIERQIPLEEVPLPAMASAKTVSGATFNLARTELKSDGSLFYKIRGKNQQGFEVEVQVTADGNILQIDEQIDPSAVPETVSKALKVWVPNAPIASTWRSVRLGELYYQFVIPEFWLEVTPDASKVIINRRLR